MKSVLALSMHKAGSSIADRILVEITAAKGYKIDQISAKAWNADMPAADFFHQYQSRMQLEGVYYGMARQPAMHDMAILPQLRLIAQIRDPRDCLTSAYYSLANSHVLPENPDKRARFEARRARVAAMSVDQYALENAPDYLMRLEKIDRIIKAHPDFVLVKYETMVLNTKLWLRRISECLEHPLSDALRAKIQTIADFAPPVKAPGSIGDK